jgi:hypothetical protein
MGFTLFRNAKKAAKVAAIFCPIVKDWSRHNNAVYKKGRMIGTRSCRLLMEELKPSLPSIFNQQSAINNHQSSYLHVR